MSRFETLNHVRMEGCSVDNIFCPGAVFNAPLDEESPQPSQERSEIKQFYRFHYTFLVFYAKVQASLFGSVGKDFVYHACGHEFESRLK